MPFARIHVLNHPNTAQHRAYLTELLEQEGLFFQSVLKLPEPQATDLVIRLSGEPLTEQEQDFIALGGNMLAFALNAPMPAQRTMARARTELGHLVCFDPQPLPVASESFDEVETQHGTFPLLQRHSIGQGSLWQVAVNLADTVVTLQQGKGPVTQDLPDAPDGTGNTSEGLLKADDGCALPWELRDRTATGQPFYGTALADRWRQWLTSTLRRVVAPAELVQVAYWPEGASAVFHLSLDSDGNVPEHARTTLEFLEGLDVKATWCELDGGYGADFHARATELGHEIALHYNALEREGGHWGEADFHAQLERLKTLTTTPITSNKNHYTRFEGWNELFQWCDDAGLTLDSTRGGSKMGNRGFLFGTCHPYRPARADASGNRFKVLELGFLTQDMNLDQEKWGDTSIIEPLLDEVQAVNGCVHFLCHPSHLHAHPEVRDAIQSAFEQARGRGFRLMLARELAAWCNARRAIRAVVNSETIHLENLPSGAVIYSSDQRHPVQSSHLTLHAKEFVHD